MIVKLFIMIQEDLVFLKLLKMKKLLKKNLSHLGPEPFNSKFNLNYIYSNLKGKKKNIKNFLLIKILFLELEIFMLLKFYF